MHSTYKQYVIRNLRGYTDNYVKANPYLWDRVFLRARIRQQVVWEILQECENRGITYKSFRDFGYIHIVECENCKTWFLSYHITTYTRKADYRNDNPCSGCYQTDSGISLVLTLNHSVKQLALTYFSKEYNWNSPEMSEMIKKEGFDVSDPKTFNIIYNKIKVELKEDIERPWVQ